MYLDRFTTGDIPIYFGDFIVNMTVETEGTNRIGWFETATVILKITSKIDTDKTLTRVGLYRTQYLNADKQLVFTPNITVKARETITYSYTTTYSPLSYYHNIKLSGYSDGCWINPELYPYRYVKITNAPDLTEEDSPEINYLYVGGGSGSLTQDPIPVKIGILQPNSNEFLISRDLTVPKKDNTSGTYKFVFTEEEKATIRRNFSSGDTIKIVARTTDEQFLSSINLTSGLTYYNFAVSQWNDEEGGIQHRYYASDITTESIAEPTITIVSRNPSLDPTVKDILPETLALTGNENVIVKYASMAEFSTGATTADGEEIVSQSVECGSKKITNMYYGVIDDAESATFIFNATDSRGVAADTVVVQKSVVEYVKPTCYQEFKIELTDKTTVRISLTITGDYYNGSFGLTDNTMLLEVRYGKKNEEIGEWTAITDITPTFYRDNEYSLTITFDGFAYEESYVFQSRITDKLNLVQSSQYTIKLLPVYDWSEDDFNFNVPVKMNGETVLRHNAEANNTVLSASGGHIYLRPGGTNSTSGETIIYPDGSIKFGGSVDFGDSLSIDGKLFKDYVIESGTQEMGTNGTWYWAKWKSGKAECWGCRNFGNMAITTAWGNLYRSAILTQDLPEDLFITTPDVININIVNSNYGGWICKHENLAPSAVTTGSFIFVRPASATATPTYIGFHVIGLWTQED